MTEKNIVNAPFKIPSKVAIPPSRVDCIHTYYTHVGKPVLQLTKIALHSGVASSSAHYTPSVRLRI